MTLPTVTERRECIKGKMTLPTVTERRECIKGKMTLPKVTEWKKSFSLTECQEDTRNRE
jgi:hypothetical protein